LTWRPSRAEASRSWRTRSERPSPGTAVNARSGVDVPGAPSKASASGACWQGLTPGLSRGGRSRVGSPGCSPGICRSCPPGTAGSGGSALRRCPSGPRRKSPRRRPPSLWLGPSWRQCGRSCGHLNAPTRVPGAISGLGAVGACHRLLQAGASRRPVADDDFDEVR
jgi:hypothetical protein